MKPRSDDLPTLTTPRPNAAEIDPKALVLIFQQAVDTQSTSKRWAGKENSIKNYYDMILQFVKIYRMHKHLLPDEQASTIDQLATFIETLDMPNFQRIVEALPSLLDDVILDNTASFACGEKEAKIWRAFAAKLSANLPAEIDLTDSRQDEIIFATVEKMTRQYPDIRELLRFDKWLIRYHQTEKACKHPLLLASKIALSKLQIPKLNEGLHVSLVIAMYHEHNRILPKSENNKNGENFLCRKYHQMQWLLGDNPAISWDILLVDDGCDKNSAEIAKGIIHAENLKNVDVIFLEDGIASQSLVLKGLKSTSESKKGGSIQYGMWQALKKSGSEKRHIVVYTDADMAANIAQGGLLLEKLFAENAPCVIGSRYDAGSVCLGPWGHGGNIQGLNSFDRLMLGVRAMVLAKLFPPLAHITDTQCAFKAFRADILPLILPAATQRQFAFDVELLFLSAVHGKMRQVPHVPFYWQDSVNESNFKWDWQDA